MMEKAPDFFALRDVQNFSFTIYSFVVVVMTTEELECVRASFLFHLTGLFSSRSYILSLGPHREHNLRHFIAIIKCFYCYLWNSAADAHSGIHIYIHRLRSFRQ